MTTHTLGGRSFPTPIISPLYRSETRPLALAWTIYDAATVTSPLYAANTATDAASLVAAMSGFATVSQNLVYADAHHIGYHLVGRVPIRGPATQRPRPTQPFILPDNTPPEDDDESGSLPTASPHPDPVQREADGPAYLARATYEFSWQRQTPTPNIHRLNPQAPRGFSPGSARKTVPDIQLPTAPTTPYTIGSAISSIPIDALDPTQIWSGYIPSDALPSVLDPAAGVLATANARIVTDLYPYAIANDWVSPYRVERIYSLLQNRSNLTPADMLAVQTDTHSELDLLIAQRLAYALDHAKLTLSDPRLHQAADFLRDFNGDMTPNSAAAAIVSATRAQLWPMLLGAQLHSPRTGTARPHKLAKPDIADLLDLYTWEESHTALEQVLQHTPARWLPRTYPNWNELLATAVQQGLKQADAPSDLAHWTYGSIHPVDIAHPIFGSTGLVSRLLGTPTGTGLHPNGGDSDTIKATGLHFGPSERFTADLSSPDNTHANITTGESGNPASPHFLDQFQIWLTGTTLTLPLTHPTILHTLTLIPPTTNH
jgi:penicillin amidase